MKKETAILLLGSVALLVACGEKKQTNRQPPVRMEVVNNKPMPSSSPMLREIQLKIGGMEYSITIDRKVAHEYPIVVDENGTQFYDNRVEIEVRCRGKNTISRVFTKKDFSRDINHAELQADVLQGMTLINEKCTTKALVFGAQVGQPGMDGEGSTFLVYLYTNGGAKVEKVSNQIEMID